MVSFFVWWHPAHASVSSSSSSKTSSPQKFLDLTQRLLGGKFKLGLIPIFWLGFTSVFRFVMFHADSMKLETRSVSLLAMFLLFTTGLGLGLVHITSTPWWTGPAISTMDSSSSWVLPSLPLRSKAWEIQCTRDVGNTLLLASSSVALEWPIAN